MVSFDRTLCCLAAFASLWLAGCGDYGSEATIAKETRSRGEMVVDSAMAYHGVLADTLLLGFTFRERSYAVQNHDGKFRYSVQYSDSSGRIAGILTNDGYIETLNGGWASLSEKDSAAKAERLNSVIYFALLPAKLSDASAHKEYDGEDLIKDKRYHRVRVTFGKEGGGKDYDDVFLYWFDQEDYSMDYLAYSFSDNGGGTRFRSAKKSRRLNGIVFQDYDNFKGPAPDSLQHVASMYSKGLLTWLSDIELTKISIRLYNGGEQ